MLFMVQLHIPEFSSSSLHRMYKSDFHCWWFSFLFFLWIYLVVSASFVRQWDGEVGQLDLSGEGALSTFWQLPGNLGSQYEDLC